MKAAGMLINMTEDTPVVFGDNFNLRTIFTGHYVLPLFSDDPNYGSPSPSLSGVHEHFWFLFKSSAKKEKTAREHTQTSYPHKRSVCCRAHRRQHEFDSASPPHVCPSAVASAATTWWVPSSPIEDFLDPLYSVNILLIWSLLCYGINSNGLGSYHHLL